MNNIVIVAGGNKGTQSYIYMYPFSLEHHSHPSRLHKIEKSYMCYIYTMEYYSAIKRTHLVSSDEVDEPRTYYTE